MTHRLSSASAPTSVVRAWLVLCVLGAASSWAQTAGPPATATTPEGEPPAQPPPEIPPAPPDAPMPAEVEAAAEDSTPTAPAPVPAGPTEVTLDFIGLWAGPDEADVGFTVEERVREALARPPFSLNDGPSSPIAPACLEDAACRSEKLGGRAERWVVAGAISGEATQITLTLVLLAPESGEKVARASVAETSNDEGRARLLQSVDPVVTALLQTLDPAAGPAVPASVALIEEREGGDDEGIDEPVPVPEDETRSRLWQEEEKVEEGDDKRALAAKTPAPATKAPAEASGEINYGAWIWSGGFLGAGAVMAVVGVAFDLFSPTSVDNELGLFDAVGPGLVLTGATVALVGLAVNPFLWMALADEEGEADAQP